MYETAQDISPPAPQSEMAEMLALLKQQKSESDNQRALQQQQADQMRTLQDQVSSLLQRDHAPQVSAALYSNPATASFTPPSSISSMSTMTTTVPTYTSTAAAPQMVIRAAESLAAAFQAGLGQNNAQTSLTMDQLRADPNLMQQAAAVLASATHNIPPLNSSPLDGMGVARSLQNNQVVISNVDQLYRATTINKQLKCHEFASTGQFSYRHLIKQDNINATTFAFGAFKHLEACKSGLINVSDAEFLARLRHQKCVRDCLHIL